MQLFYHDDFYFAFNTHKAEQQLQGVELQEKEDKESKSSLERALK